MSRADGRQPAAPSSAVFVALAFVAVSVCEVALARAILWGTPGTILGFTADAAFVALLAIIVAVLPRRWAGVLAVTFTALLSFLLLTAVVYSAYFEALPTFDMLGFAGHAAEMRASIVDLWVPANWLFLACVPVMAILAALAPRSGRRLARSALGVVAAVAAVGVALLSISLMHADGVIDSLQAARARGIVAYEVSAVFSASGMVDEAPALRGSTGSGASMEDTGTQDGLGGLIEAILGRADARRIVSFKRGVAEGKNVIVIQCEALQTLVVGQTVNGQVVTPNIDKLISTSVYFPNGISQLAKGNTSDVEFTANSGIYPSMDKASSLAYGDRLIPGLPRLLSLVGYRTVTMHANRVGYWNRREMYASLGFDDYYDVKYFGVEDRIGMGASDKVFFRKSLPLITALRDEGTPFYAYLVTLSSHAPFSVFPKNKREFELAPPFDGTPTGDYVQAMHYLDSAVGEFVDALEEEHLLDDCVLLVFGDHFGLRGPSDDRDSAAQRKLVGRPYTGADKLAVPIILRLPGQWTPLVIEDPVGDVDIMPTLADLLGIDLAGVPQFGRSAFERGRILLAQRRHVPAGSYVTEDGVVIAGFGFDGATGQPFPGRANVVPIRRKDYDDGVRLVSLSDEYARALPVRSDAKADPGMRIPTKAGLGE